MKRQTSDRCTKCRHIKCEYPMLPAGNNLGHRPGLRSRAGYTEYTTSQLQLWLSQKTICPLEHKENSLSVNSTIKISNLYAALKKCVVLYSNITSLPLQRTHKHGINGSRLDRPHIQYVSCYLHKQRTKEEPIARHRGMK